MKINFIEEKVTAVEVRAYSFKYKLEDKEEQAKHNLVSHVVFQSNIRYCSRIPERPDR